MAIQDDESRERAVPNPRAHAKNWSTWLGVVTIAASALLMSSATAAQGADPAQVCTEGRSGAGPYTRVANSWSVPGGQGTLYLFYNGDTGYNCAVTVGNVSGSTYMDVGLRQADNDATTDCDEGNFAQFAGPVYVQARGICVDVTGAVGDRSVVATGTNCGS
jgi:hypothetical protein